MRRHLLRILACYIVGLVVGNLMFVPVFGVVAIFTMIVGILAGLPEFLVTILIFVSFRSSILRYPLPWCAAAPFLTTAMWLAVEWFDGFSSRGHDVYWYLSLPGTWERAALAFSCAAVGSALFWYQTPRISAERRSSA
jgi:hypothetical protein